MLLPKNSHLAQVLLQPNDVNMSSPHLSWLQSFSGVIPRKVTVKENNCSLTIQRKATIYFCLLGCP